MRRDDLPRVMMNPGQFPIGSLRPQPRLIPVDREIRPVGDGTFKFGRKPGRKPHVRLKQYITSVFDAPPTPLEVSQAARGLSILIDEVPSFDTGHELWAWVFYMHALRGSPEHSKELLDRMAPKPSRNEVTVNVNGTRDSAMMRSRFSDGEARDYMEALTIDVTANEAMEEPQWLPATDSEDATEDWM